MADNIYETFRDKMARRGENLRDADKKQSVQLMESGFTRSQMYREVIMNGNSYDARITEGSSTTIRGGKGNYLIQFRDGIYPPAGTYVQIPDNEDNYEMWLITYESDSILFPKHIIQKCNYELKWKNDRGKIITRWAVFRDNERIREAENFVNNQYNVPESSTSLLIPCDEETIRLQMSQRFLIDHKAWVHHPDAWSITNKNVISKTFNDYEGVIELMVKRHQYNTITDNAELMVADYYVDSKIPDDDDSQIDYAAKITYTGTSNIKIGTPFKTYTAQFYANGELVESSNVTWEVKFPSTDIEAYFTHEVDEDDPSKLKIKCALDTKLIGSFIRLIAYDKTLGASAELPAKVVSSI